MASKQNPPRPKKDANGLYPCPCGGRRHLMTPDDDGVGVYCTRDMLNTYEHPYINRKTRAAAIRAANRWVNVWWGKEEA
jgi:hypothetical protein